MRSASTSAQRGSTTGSTRRTACSACRSGGRATRGEGFFQLGTAALLRGDLEQAYSLYDRARPLLAEGTLQRAQVDSTLDELEPLVRDRARERAESNKRRGMAPYH